MKKRMRFIAAAVAAFLLLSGCALSEIGGLYSLPQATEEYLQLQELIDAEIAEGSEYSAPTVGSLRQSIQLADLDGDGTNEALAFLRNAEKQPEICIYRKNGANFEPAAFVVGDGDAIGRVEYEDLDGDGFLEILTSWEVSAEMRLLKVYSLRGWKQSVLLTSSCLDFLIGDLNSDGVSDVLTLDLDTSGGKVDMFTIDRSGEVNEKTAELSSSLITADRFRIANIDGEVPAAFIEGQYSADDSSCLLTDIIVCKDGELRNITRSVETGDSDTKRSYSVYCTDIDGNGTLDVPYAEMLENSSASSAEHFVFDWFSYAADGNKTKCVSTYHNYSDGWFFEIPDEWRDKLSVKKESIVSGEKAVVFSLNDSQSGRLTNMLTVYTLTDENRLDRAKFKGRFVLMSSDTVVFAAKIMDTNISEQEIIDRFHLISSEWNAGLL